MDETPIIQVKQDRSSEAWKRLCHYIDRIERDNSDEFSPLEELGPELFSQIFTLPESIGRLKHVKKLWLYGSNIQVLPPEIGEMEYLEYFDPYTSYDLNWFPYEITKCKKLIDSRVSVRALYGNFKNRKSFPDLTNNPIRYNSATVKCSVCEKISSYKDINQKWITLRVGTDDMPLLVNLCSIECENKLPEPRKGYVNKPHKGGIDLKQPTNDEWLRVRAEKMSDSFEKSLEQKKDENKPFILQRLIRKIWDR